MHHVKSNLILNPSKQLINSADSKNRADHLNVGLKHIIILSGTFYERRNTKSLS